MEPATVNYREIHRQLTTDAILIKIQAEALSSIITLNLSKFLKCLSNSLEIPTKFIQQNHK